ncbi:MAG: VPLPA-CTERM sorting domain-containing protein [Paracoccaceae bacterium]
MFRHSLAVLVFSATVAQAATTSFTDLLSYNTAVGAELFSIDFNGPASGGDPGDYVGKVDFGSPEASDPTLVNLGSNALSDAGSTTAANGVGPVDGVFYSAVHAFRLDFLSSGLPQTIELYDATANLIASVITPASGFFGVKSDTAIGSFIIRNGEFSANTRDRFFIDNFAANAISPIPLPASFPLALLGLGAFALVRRRKG